MGLKGARQVVGIDIRESAVRDAANFVSTELPAYVDRIRFSSAPIGELERQAFDLVVSKDAFEHIIDAPTMLRELSYRLSPSGRMFIGFSPLYHSPYGDHDRRRTAFRDWGAAGALLAAVPWGHLVMEPLIVRRHRKIQGRDIQTIQDLNLNAMNIDEFRRYIEEAGLMEHYFATNQGHNPLRVLFSMFTRVPVLRRYCTYNAYCILQHRTGQPQRSS